MSAQVTRSINAVASKRLGDRMTVSLAATNKTRDFQVSRLAQSDVIAVEAANECWGNSDRSGLCLQVEEEDMENRSNESNEKRFLPRTTSDSRGANRRSRPTFAGRRRRPSRRATRGRSCSPNGRCPGARRNCWPCSNRCETTSVTCLQPTTSTTSRVTGFYRVLLAILGLCRVLLWSSWFLLVVSGFHGALPGYTGFYLVLLGFTGFYRVLPDSTGFYLVFTGFSRVLPGFTGFYWVLPGFTGFNWVFIDFWQVLLGFTGLFNWVLLGFNGFWQVLMGFTGFYWVLLSFTWF